MLTVNIMITFLLVYKHGGKETNLLTISLSLEKYYAIHLPEIDGLRLEFI